MVNFKPLANIGDVVNIVGCDVLQTKYGWKTVDLLAKNAKGLIDYYVHDVEVTVSLKSGEVKYSYLISTNKEKLSQYCTGWVKNIKLKVENEEVDFRWDRVGDELI